MGDKVNLCFATGEEKKPLLVASKTEAYLGAHNRVFLREKDALVDLAATHLANRFLSKGAGREGHGTYAQLMSVCRLDPELFILTADLIRLEQS